MARAIWKGSITFGLVNIPVQLFSAEKPGEQLRFHLLDKKTHSRIRNQRINETGDPVNWEDIDHAYEFEKGKYVIVDEKMLEQAAADTYEKVEIESFVPFAQINPLFFEKPYYLIPADAGMKGYVLLHDILKKSKKVAIATVVIKTRQHLAAILPEDDYLTLIILRYAKELHSLKDFAQSTPINRAKLKIKPKEAQLAEQLVASMSGAWEPDRYRDDSKELLRKLISADIKKGKSVSQKAKAHPKSGKVLDFAELLKQSVSQKSKRAKPAKKTAKR